MSTKLHKIQQDFQEHAEAFAEQQQHGTVRLEIHFAPGGHLSKNYTIAIEKGASVSPGTAAP